MTDWDVRSHTWIFAGARAADRDRTRLGGGDRSGAREWDAFWRPGVSVDGAERPAMQACVLHHVTRIVLLRVAGSL